MNTRTFVLYVPLELDISAVIRMLEAAHTTVKYPSKDSDKPTRNLFVSFLDEDLHGD